MFTRLSQKLGVMTLLGFLFIPQPLNSQSITNGKLKLNIAQVPSKVKTVRIGYQKSGAWLILKARGILEKKLAAKGIGVKWNEFSAGVPLLEALNAGSLDIGHTGDAPAVVAQAGGNPFVYFASSRPSPESVAIVVPNDSPIQKISDLKGKKIAVGKGSSGHFFLVQALINGGVQYKDIQPAFLNPPDARVAFERKNVDAWAIWDPFLAGVQQSTGGRILVSGKGLTPFREFYLANRNFANENPDLIKLIIRETQASGDWALSNPSEVVELLAKETKVDAATLEQAERRKKRYGAKLIENPIIAEQQKVADIFFQLGLIPKQIRVSEVVWNPNK